jgi:hypothetical protein
MRVLYPSITEFLDTPENERQRGRYIFYDEEEQYLEQISNDVFSYKVRRYPGIEKPGIVDIYLNYASLADVFSVTSATRATYVSRELKSNITYEATLQLFLREPGGIVVIFGPSKLGKTVLWQSIIDQSECIRLSCSPNITIDSLYQQILYDLSQPYITESAEENINELTKKKSADLTFGPPGSQAKIGVESEKGKTKGSQKKYEYAQRQYNVDTVVKELSGIDKTIVFENYHRLSLDALRQLCIDLRTFSDSQINTLFVGIPKNPYELTSLNKELEGRVSFLPFSFWTQKELQRIALGGQAILRAYFTQSSLEFISGEAAGSPLLMQLYCYIACVASKVLETQEQEHQIDISADDFSKAIKEFGIQRLEPCKQTCKVLKKEAKNIRGLPSDFIDKMFKEIKKSIPQLTMDLRRFKLWPEKKSAVRKLITELNKNEYTLDLFNFDEEQGILNISSPTFLAYVRWIYGDTN